MDNDPLYEQGLKHFGLGEWSEAAACFTQLQVNYPADDRAKQFLESARLRAAGNVGLTRSARTEARTGWLSRLSSLGIVAILLIIVVLVFAAYQAWVVPVQAESARLAHLDELRRTAEVQIASGQYTEAMATLQTLLTAAPDDQAASAALQHTQQLAQISALYAQATQALNAGDSPLATKLLQQITAIDPNYRDSNSLLAQIKSTQDLSQTFATAVGAYTAGSWQQAAQAFESIRATNQDFEPDQIKDYLFNAYLQLGDQQIKSASTTASVQLAGSYYQKALSVRPLEPKADAASRLASTFVDGAQAYQAKDWENVIRKLGIVYEQQPDYFSGSVKQWLYEAYLTTGNTFLTKGDPFTARDRFAVALRLASTDAEKKEAQARYDTANKLTTPTPTPRPSPSPQPAGYVPPAYTLRPTGTPNPYPFIMINTTYLPNTFTGDGCGWTGVTGRIFDRNGKPLVLDTLGVRVSGPDVIGVAAGSYQSLGDSGWLVQYDVVAKEIQGTVQVFYKDKPVSDPIPYTTHRSCFENLLIIDIQQIRALP